MNNKKSSTKPKEGIIMESHPITISPEDIDQVIKHLELKIGEVAMELANVDKSLKMCELQMDKLEQQSEELRDRQGTLLGQIDAFRYTFNLLRPPQ